MLFFVWSSACFACHGAAGVMGVGKVFIAFVLVAAGWVSVTFVSWELRVVVEFVDWLCSGVVLGSCWANFVVVVFFVVGEVMSDGF